MWTRRDLKENARTALRLYYWQGVLACLIATLLGAGLTRTVNVNEMIVKSEKYISDYGGGYSVLGGEYLTLLAMAVTAMGLIWGIMGIFFKIFVSDVVFVGKLSFFLESRYGGYSAGMGRLFFGFFQGNYLNIVKIMFLKTLFEVLWFLFFIIPGIVKRYEYYMVPYLLAEEPALDRKEAFSLSKRMMMGNKFDTWVLELSFVGWYLLGLLACGVGLFFVHPYEEATKAELYLRLKEKVFVKPETSQHYDWDRTYTGDFKF